MTSSQLSYEVFGCPQNQQIRSLCNNIYSGKFWREISCQYNIQNYKRSSIFSIPQVKHIYYLISKNKDISTEEILQALSINNYSKEEYVIYNRAIRLIRLGKSYKNISQEYNI